jgi:hypothetical protein
MVRAWPGEAHLAKARSLLDEAKTNEVKTFTVSTEDFLKWALDISVALPGGHAGVRLANDHSDPKMS